MSVILNIETATIICSVTLSKNGEILGFKESNEEKTHAKSLTIFIEELLKDNKLKPTDINAIAISKGPGSYTGLRIGVSTAKGLAYAVNSKLIAINTLQAMAFGIIEKIQNKEIDIPNTNNILLCPMIDARRMEVYSAIFNLKGKFVRDVEAEVIDTTSFSDTLKNNKILFFGDGSDKLTNTIIHKNAIFIENFKPSSKYMVELSHQAYKKNDFVDLAYFEPFYLKDFIAIKPKKNIFI
ncbi:MAG: tRNA (adenosine(37)-N6)-threonylcarbamoyltransferase complex dimerization subunit type 1 TsaB [Bacteroidales bacterium]|jgi:tRNA threonylcarbamoyladenosine biosynthesis protein TsaB|nr:tRNA (adenosine(37)-N6)-threonylcarbamoyltransferase complex dimerization subunit type 1 TsaB [Bacteroidales bacterium]